MAITRIGIVVKQGSYEAMALSGDIAESLVQKNVDVYGDVELAKRVDGMKGIDRQDMPNVVDCIIVLGGDGTMLYTARLVAGRKVPILGVNMGSLGFMTSIKVEEVFANLDKVLKGDFELEERMMLSVNIGGASKSISYSVLNDVVIKSTMARLCNLETKVDGDLVNNYRCDGLILATPTGSTGYSLSAQGPILYPTIHSIILVPICPFNLTNRPIVVADTMEVEVTVGKGNESVQISLDGQIDMPLNEGSIITVKRAEKSVFLIKCEGKSYFDILRERLLWEIK
ncbi:MAG: NAD(+)/NADH kinase [Deltaproteobacteria bacterium]|nr:NAD(+)/NADH kinase [Deltaproteobacteria bacterium]